MAADVVSASGPSTDGRIPDRKQTGGSSARGTSTEGAGSEIHSHAVRILIVEDDPNILTSVAKMAFRLGYRCTEAVDALDALFHLNQTHHDLVISDDDMPFMNGFQLADQIKRRHPMTKVIIMSGQCEAVIKELVKGSAIVDGLLFKPFNLDTMKRKIEEIGTGRFLSSGPGSIL